MLPTGSSGLWALRLPQNSCLQHQQAPGKRTSAEDSALPIPACPVLARAASGQSWQQLGPSICTLGSWHCCKGLTSPAQPLHSVWISSRNSPPLCSLVPGDTSTTIKPQPGEVSPPLSPALCTRGPETRAGSGRDGGSQEAAGGGSRGAEIGEKPGQAFPFLGAAELGWQVTGLGTRCAVELEVSTADGAVPSHGPAASTVLAAYETFWGVSNSRG